MSNDLYDNFVIRSDINKIIFPKIGYYTVFGNVDFTGTCGYREVYVILNGDTSKKYFPSSLTIFGDSESSLQFSGIINITSLSDYIQVYCLTDVDDCAILDAKIQIIK